jgi:protein O-GlcNAc transferase
MKKLAQEALSLHQQQQVEAAEQKYKEHLQQNSDDAEAWLNLGILYYETRDYEKSQAAILNSLEVDGLNAWAYYSLGCCLEGANYPDQAILAYQDAIALDSSLIDAYNNLGNLLAQTGEIAQAEAVYRQAIAVNPTYFGSYLNLGNLLLSQHQIESAIAAYQTVLTLNPENADGLNNLEIALNIQKNPTQYLLESAHSFYQKAEYEAALQNYQKFLQTNNGDANVYFNLSECFSCLNREAEAIRILEEGISLYPSIGKLHFSLVTILHRSGRTEAAISSSQRAASLLPDDYAFKILENLLLPIFYETPDEIAYYRQRYERGLQNLIGQTSLDPPEKRKAALQGIGATTNFYLVYQAQNDLKLQQQYGNLVHQIMAVNYPQWVEHLSMPPLPQNNKIRIGYLSAYLHSYSGSLWLLGWLRHCDRQKFEIYC